ncbi:MAG: nickel pincer cofactor biosynthesis protein LarC [Planctomycetaceae bacterium]
MRIVYLDCAAGISGDMTVAALIDAGVDWQAVQAGIKSLGLPGVELQLTETMRGGFRARHLKVVHPEQHAHRHLSDIEQILDRSDVLTQTQYDLALRMFRAVAEAEAKVHGSSVDQIHFHEVGAIDSIVDITAAAIAFDLLHPDEIVCSPIPTGRGFVNIAHGVCAVPTPGTAELLRGIPLANADIAAELTTPTGAAIVKTVVDRFAPGLPDMTVESVGYGAGTRNLDERANLLRIFVGTAEVRNESDEVVLLETNLDDVSAEVIGYTKQRLLSAGALDVYSSAIQMKKDRPGTLLSVLGRPADVGKLESILFQETETFGVRRQTMRRSLRARTAFAVDTEFGLIQGKLGWREGEPAVFTPEYEACVKIASAYQVPLRDVYRAAEMGFLTQLEEGEEQDLDCCDDHDHGTDHDHTHDHGTDHDHTHDHDHHHHDHDHHHDHHH